MKWEELDHQPFASTFRICTATLEEARPPDPDHLYLYVALLLPNSLPATASDCSRSQPPFSHRPLNPSTGPRSLKAPSPGRQKLLRPRARGPDFPHWQPVLLLPHPKPALGHTHHPVPFIPVSSERFPHSSPPTSQLLSSAGPEQRHHLLKAVGEAVIQERAKGLSLGEQGWIPPTYDSLQNPENLFH